MSQTQWIRMTREQAAGVLTRLGAQKDALVFSKDVTDVSWKALPFYSKWRLCKLTNFATMPVFTMTYLTDGDDYIALDGTANPIYTVDEKAPLMLTEENVAAYLEFFFSNVQGSEGEVFVIRDPQTMPMMKSLSAEQQSSVLSSFQPVRVWSTGGGFNVEATLHYGGSLLGATIVVAQDGKISFQEQRLLLAGVYFPDSLYGRSWMSG